MPLIPYLKVMPPGSSNSVGKYWKEVRQNIICENGRILDRNMAEWMDKYGQRGEGNRSIDLRVDRSTKLF